MDDKQLDLFAGTQQEIERLRREIRKHDKRYYIDAQPIISDQGI